MGKRPRQHRGPEKRGPAGELAYGLHPVLEALGALPDEVPSGVALYLADTRSDASSNKACELAQARGVALHRVTNGELDKLTAGARHQGFVLDYGSFPYVELEELLEQLGLRDEGDASARILVLDQLQDPRNLGALLRSAAAFGYHGVVIAKDRAASVSAATIKVSAGGAWHVPVARVTNVVRALELLREAGFWMYGAALEGAEEADAVSWAERSALVLGTEGKGLRRLVRNHCDVVVRIPHSDAVESLNVSVAGAILMYVARPKV